jgi:hypothetical protein
MTNGVNVCLAWLASRSVRHSSFVIRHFMNSSIAIVGMACVYLDTRSPERLRPEDYFSAAADLPACEIWRRWIQKQLFCQPDNSKKPE